MTNKLPEVGKRYKTAGENRDLRIIEVVKIENNSVCCNLVDGKFQSDNPIYIKNEINLWQNFYIDLDKFWKQFKSVEDNLQNTCGYCGGTGTICLPTHPPQFEKCRCSQNTPQSAISEEDNNEIEKAKKTLKIVLSPEMLFDEHENLLSILRDKAQALLDVLDKQEKSMDDSNIPQNPVSGGKDYIGKNSLRDFLKEWEIVEYRILTDFIIDYEALKAEVAEIKKKMEVK